MDYGFGNAKKNLNLGNPDFKIEFWSGFKFLWILIYFISYIDNLL